MFWIIFLSLGAWKAVNDVNKQYKWYHNLEITMRSQKGLFLYLLMAWATIIQMATLIYITSLSDKLAALSPKLSFIMMLFNLCFFGWICLKYMEKSKRIEEIKSLYINGGKKE